MRRGLRRFALVASAVCVALIVAEGFARVRHARERDAALGGRVESELETVRLDGERKYGLRPGVPGFTNRHGFRDLERERVKPAGALRIAMIGDSVGMQREIDFDALYWRRLESELRALPGLERVEVLGFAVSGYDTRQERALLEEVVLDFGPDAILWQFHDNDAAVMEFGEANGELGTLYARPWSRLWLSLSKRWSHRRKARCLEQAGSSELPADLQEQFFRRDEVLDELRRVRALTEARGIEVFLFWNPSWPPGDDWSRVTPAALELHASLARGFESQGFDVLDLLPLALATDPALLRAAPDDPWHPSAAGHAWIARELAAWLGPRLLE